MKRRILLLSACGVSLLFAGCASVLETLGNAVGDRPDARITGVRLRDVGLRSLVLAFDVTIDNPYAVALPLLDLDFALASGADPIVSGNSEVSGSVPAQGSLVVPLPVEVDLVGLVTNVARIRPGQVVPYEAQLGISVDAPQLGRLRLPLSKSGELPVPSLPSVNVASVDWDEVSLTGIRGALRLDVGNTNDFPFTLTSLRYALDVDDHPFVSGSSQPGLELAPDARGQVEIPLVVPTQQVGLSLVRALSGSNPAYGLVGGLSVDTPFGPIDFPLGDEP